MGTCMKERLEENTDFASTGIAGLDQVLGGGLPRNRLYLVEGDPGSGKTTVGLQFLLHGMKRGQKVLSLTLSETKSELIAVAASHGWELGDMAIYELSVLENGGIGPDDQ